MACRTPALRGASSGIADRAGSCRVRRRASRARSSRSGRPTTASSAHVSSAACAGRFPASRPSTRSRVATVSQGSEMTSRASGWLASSTNSACCRSSRCSRPPATSTGRRRWLPASAWCTTAAGDDDHPVAGQVGPPAEVDVVAKQRQPAVEAAELVPHVAAHQHPGGVDREHRPGAVVLALVVLAALQAGLAPAAAGDRDADLEQQPAVAEAEHLGAGDGDLRVAGHLGEQLRERVRGGGAVVVQQPDPVGRRCQLEGGGDRRAEPGAGGEVGDRVAAEPGLHRGQRPVAALGRPGRRCRPPTTGRAAGSGRPARSAGRGASGRRGGRPARRSR